MSPTTIETLAARRELGATVLYAAGVLGVARLGPRLAAFRRAHAAFCKAEDALAAAEARLIDAQRVVAEADNEHDDAVAALAAALITVGQPRLNPFRKLSKYAPARMRQLGYAAEAEALLALSAKARKVKGVNPAVLGASREAERAARALLDAVEGAARAEERVAAARARRDELRQPWETALEALRRAARKADAEGGGGLYDTLFRGSRRPRSSPPRRADAE